MPRMQATRSAAAAAGLGSRVLSEIDEANLDEILVALRTHFATATAPNTTNDSNPGSAPSPDTRLRDFPLDSLNDLVNRHFRATQFAPLAVTGRHHELLYILVASLIASPHEKTVAIVDFEGRFDPMRLLVTAPIMKEAHTNPTSPSTRIERADLDHVHILRPSRGSVRHVADCLAAVEEYMLYGTHRSRSREWWGTVVIGGGLNPAGSVPAAMASQIAVTAGWRGWLRVDRPEVATFWGMSAEEALAERDKRQAAVEGAGWIASSPWGSFAICETEGS